MGSVLPALLARSTLLGMTPNAERRFQELVEALAAEPAMSPPTAGRNFGANALKVNGRIFAMLVRGNVGLKLPRQRVAELIAAGQAQPFDAGKGKPMKEWLTVPAESNLDWLALAREAMQFVGGRGAGRHG
jgi:hypothetical protein